MLLSRKRKKPKIKKNFQKYSQKEGGMPSTRIHPRKTVLQVHRLQTIF